MKFNNTYEEGGNFEDYLEYLDTIKSKLSKDIFDFVSNPNRHDFSKQSLHDSWIKSFECFSNFETRKNNIVLTLIGAYFDREFRLCFHGVSQYKIAQQMSDSDRDLITFEVGVEPDSNREDKFIFRAMFSGDKTELEIYYESIDISETLIIEENE